LEVYVGITVSLLGVGLWYSMLVLLTGRTFTPRGFLIDWLLPPDRADDVLNNLLGRYPYWIEKHGLLKARLIFLTQSVGTILCFWVDWVLKRANLIRFWRSS